MILKVVVKKLLSEFFSICISMRRHSESKLTTERAKAIVENVYKAGNYECSGHVCENAEYDISLIIPVYNGEKYLETCIKSLVNQHTSHKYELIFINDGSTDSSIDILHKFEKIPNVVIISQDNKGISETRNKGIEIAKGKYIGFVDNDDYVSDDYVESIMSLADELNADVIKCRCVEFDSCTGRVLRYFGTGEDSIYRNGLEEDLPKFDGFVWGGCYRKDFWGKTSFPKDYWYEDMITRFLLYRRAKSFGYLGRSLYYKREHTTNSAKKIWVSGDVKSLDQYYLTKELIRINDELGFGRDKVLFRLIVFEYGFMLGHRTKHLDNKIREAVFVMASDEINRFPKSFDYDDVFCKSLREKDYKLWKLATSLGEAKY